MGLFKRKASAATALAEPPAPASTEACSTRSGALTEANRCRRDRADRAAAAPLRHLAGVRLLESATRPPSIPRPTSPGCPTADGLPGDRARRADAGAAARRDPARRLPARARPRRPRRRARARRRRSIARSRRARRSRPARGRARLLRGVRRPRRAFEVASVRPWIREGGGVLAGDSPMLACRDARAVRGRRAAAARRRLPRRAAAAVRAQDDAAQGRAVRRRRLAPGRRLHGRRAGAQPLALALALRRRGARARHRPAPARRDRVDARRDARRGADAPRRPRRPRATRRSCGRSSSPATRCSSTSCSCTRPASDPSTMPKPRFAIESWFFGGSAFPADYAPLAV